MNDMTQVLEAGTLLIIETGEYSDSRWYGPIRMVKSATKAELAQAYRAQWKPEHDWQTEPEGNNFLPWLVKSGWAEDVENVHSWHVGSYAFEPER